MVTITNPAASRCQADRCLIMALFSEALPNDAQKETGRRQGTLANGRDSTVSFTDPETLQASAFVVEWPSRCNMLVEVGPGGRKLFTAQ